MHREDLMSADMLSEILLLVCGSVIFVALLLTWCLRFPKLLRGHSHGHAWEMR